MPVLPPLTQTFNMDAVKYLASVDEMITATDRLAERINLAAEAAGRMSGELNVTGEIETRLIGIENAVADGADRIVVAMDEVAVAVDRAGAAIDANTAAVDANAGAMDAQAASAERSGAASAGAAARSKTAFLAVGAALVYGVVKAAKFQTEVTRLYTAAGLTHASYNRVADAILRIGDATGQTGTAIAEAMYHPISAGLSLASALKVVAFAAQLAAIHGANLDDTTYALSSLMKGYNLRVSDVANTSKLLNAIVGQGDMRFQDFNESIKNWVPTMAGMGISIRSAGAALAYLTDRGNPAEVAATRLSMGLTMLTSGSKQANTILGALGLTTTDTALRNTTLAQVLAKAGISATTLSADLKKPDGIFVALSHLKEAFKQAGVSGAMADTIMAKLFGGGRSDKAMLALMQNLDGLRQKYRSIGGAVKDYGKSWSDTQKTTSYEAKAAWHDVQNLATSFGQLLLPAVTKVLGWFNRLFSYLQAHPALAKVVGAFIAVSAAAVGVTAAVGGIIAAFDPVTLIVAAVMAIVVGLYELYKHCKLVREVVADVGKFFVAAWRDALHIAGDIIKWFDNGPLVWIKQQIAVFTKWWDQHHAEVMRITKAAWAYISMIIKTTLGILKTMFQATLPVVVGIIKAAWDVLWGTTKIIWTVIGTTISTVIHTILDVVGAVLDILQGHWSAAGHELAAATSAIWNGIKHIITSVTSDFGTLLLQAGHALISGLLHGIEAGVGGIINTVAGLGHSIAGVFGKVLHIFSPSRVFYELGARIVEGLMLGIAEHAYQAREEAAKLAREVAAAAAGGEITSSQAAQLDAKISEALHRDLNELARRKAELVKKLHEIGLALQAGLWRGLTGKSPSAVNSAIKTLVSLVKEAFAAGSISYSTATWLTKLLEHDDTRLMALATRREAVLKQIAAADKYAATTATNVRSWAGLANIASALPAGGAVTGGALLAGLQQDLAKIKQFNAALKRLAALGLNKNLLDQIVQAGPDQGLQLAQALLDGPIGQIRALNRTETQIGAAATQIGQTAANAMYDSGKYAGRGFLSGLQAQEKAIEELMAHIAKGMILRLRKELGISSPSRVAHQHGFDFMRGLAEGLLNGKTLVDQAMSHAVTSMTYRTGSLAGGGTGGGAQTINLTVKVDAPGFVMGTSEEVAVEVAHLIQPVLLQLENRNPTSQFAGKR